VNSSASGVNLEVGGVETRVVTAEVGGGGVNGLIRFSFALDGDRVSPI